MCRFINADDSDVVSETMDDVTDKNLFAYCDNNPVCRADDGGDFYHILVGAAVGASISAAIQIADNLHSKQKWNSGLLTSVASGAFSGGFAASGLGIGWQIGVNAALGGLENYNEQRKSGSFSCKKFAASIAIGDISGLAGGKGKGSKHLTNLGKQATKRISNSVKKKSVKYTVNTTKKAMSYYKKNTGKYYKNYAKGLWKDVGVSSATSYANNRNMR